MYHAKMRSISRYTVFDQSLKSAALERLQRESDLRHALEQSSLEIVYQPIVTLASREVVEPEALIQWEHPRRGRISSSEFLPVAE
jgi:EAL domain-containing protein (putative c-di-GMP-specific phosphodiesterase class I)